MGRRKRSQSKTSGMTREPTAADIAAWLERLIVPEGTLLGRRFKLAPFQIEALQAVYDNPHGPTRRAIFSWARKQGKTTFSACLLLTHLIGPKARPNSQLYSTAMSREQA